MALAAGLAMLGTVPQASAAGTSGQITLGADVPNACTVSVENVQVSLDLSGPSQSTQVATIVENCNSPDGYVVNVSSKDGGVLSSGEASTKYKVTYGGTKINPTTGSKLWRSGPADNVARALVVTVPDSRKLPPGTYTDTLTVTISAN